MSNNRVIYRPVIIFIFYCFAAVSHLSAQEKSTWTLNHILNADNGLPQNSITDLYFDHITGFLWIATEGGLANYNGISTKIFDSRNVSGFRMSRIMQFTRTVDNKIIVIDKSAIGVPISGNSVKTRGGVDYSFYNNGNFSFQRMPPLKDTNFLARLKTISEKIGKPVSIATSLISCIDDSTTLVFRREGSAHIVRKAAFNLPVYLPYAYTLLNIKPGNNVAALDSTGNGYFIDVSQKKVVPVKSANPDLFKGGYAIYPDNINDRHYLLKGKKLYEFQISNTTIELKLLADLPELPQSNIMHISVHPNNNQVYFGTLYHGVYIYTRSFISTYQLNDIKKYTGENRYSSLPLVSNFLASVLIDSNQTLVGFRSGGEWGQTALLNLKDSTFDFILKSNWPSTYAIDRQKNVYVQFKGLTRYSFDLYKKTTFHTYKVSTTAFYYDSKYDRVWVADNQKGIFGFLKGDSMQEYFRYSLSLAPNLAVIKRTNNMLVAFNENSFLRVDEVNKKFEQLYFFDKPCLRDVYIDEDSLAWLSTYGQGLYMYNLKTGKIYHPKPDSKMYLLFAHCVADDGRGNFFIPTNNGLFHINRKALITACMDSTQTVFYHYYDKTRGLLQNEFNGGCQPSFNRMYNGDLLFPSMHGLVRLHSTSVSEPGMYPLFIQKITSPYKTYDFSNDMVFDVRERVLTWEVNFAQWDHPDASGLSYQLDNDKTWKYLDAGERNIRLANLEGGNHALRIRNQFDLAGNKISMLNIDFYVEKKYHEKAWFWILLTVFLFAVIYMAAALRNLQLKRQNIQLERTIHSKTLEVKTKNADLNQALEHLEQNSRFQQKLIGVLGHDIMVPLQYIAKVAKQVITYKEKLSEETKTGAVEEIGNTASQLLYLGESLIHWLKLQEGNFIPHYSGFHIHDLVEELVHLHQPIAAEKGNTIINEIPRDLYCVQEPVIIRVVLHNLLLNANKFTTKGKISISGEMKEDILSIIVSDNGAGMDSELVSDLNNLKAGLSKKGTENEKGWGLGYRFIIDLLAFVNGKFSISSEKGKGTNVTIHVSDMGSMPFI